MAEPDIPRLYYSIGEVSEMVGQEPHVLRYWESEFDVLDPRKNRAGRRVYTEDDIATIRRIHYLLKDKKYTIAGARQAIAQEEQGPDEKALREELTELRSFLKTVLEKL